MVGCHNVRKLAPTHVAHRANGFDKMWVSIRSLCTAGLRPSIPQRSSSRSRSRRNQHRPSAKGSFHWLAFAGLLA